MDFNISEEQQEIKDSIIKLCKIKLNANIYENDQKAVFSLDKWKLCSQLGILGLPIPEKYGGIGQNMLTTAIAIQSLGYGCKDEGLIFSVCAHMLTCAIPVLHFGSEQQKLKYLPKLSSGEYIGGNGMTEADAGSDISSITTKVVKEETGYCINGTKIFVTNGPVANLLIIYAKHQGGIKILDISAFLVETNNTGFKIGQVFEKMGLRTSTMSEVVFNNCRIPAINLLGRERMGIAVFNHSMLWERIIMAAYHIGAMEQQYELTVKYAGMRRQFGQKIIKNQSISNKLVDMKINIETSRLMLYKACWNYDNNRPDLSEAAMLKLVASNAKVKNSLAAVQIFGAYGYIKESDVEKQLRDSIASTIYSGTTEIQRNIISEKIESDVI